MKLLHSARWILLALLLSLVPASSYAGVFISVGFAPPMLPVYEQPPCPEPGLMWQPGYWAYGDYGYYWVPGAWVPAPYYGALWTPGYWGWGDGLYMWHPGYWGMHVGYYGGIDYGYGYMGIGFVGGRWHDNDFEYNTAIMHVDRDRIRNVYEDREDVNRYRVARDSHVAYNGGRGGIRYQASPAERAAMHEQHMGPTAYQMQHVNSAKANRNAYAKFNGGRPSNLVASRPLQGVTRPTPSNMRQGPQGSFNNNRGGANSQFGSQPQNMHQTRPTNGNQPQASPNYQNRPQAQPQYQQRQQPQNQNRPQAQPQYQQRPQPQISNGSSRIRTAQPQYQQRQQPQYQQRQQAQPQYQQRPQPQSQYQQRQQPQYQQRPQPQYQERPQQQYQQRPQPQYQERPQPQYRAAAAVPAAGSPSPRLVPHPLRGSSTSPNRRAEGAKREASSRNQQGPRAIVGLAALCGGRLDAGDLDFEAAVFGVVVFADAVGDVDVAALGQPQFRGAEGHVPAHGADRSAGAESHLRGAGWVASGQGLGQVQADVAVFHEAERGQQARVARDKDGLGVAVAQRLQLAQPAGQHGRDAVQRQLGVDAQQALGLARRPDAHWRKGSGGA